MKNYVPDINLVSLKPKNPELFQIEINCLFPNIFKTFSIVRGDVNILKFIILCEINYLESYWASFAKNKNIRSEKHLNLSM